MPRSCKAIRTLGAEPREVEPREVEPRGGEQVARGSSEGVSIVDALCRGSGCGSGCGSG